MSKGNTIIRAIGSDTDDEATKTADTVEPAEGLEVEADYEEVTVEGGDYAESPRNFAWVWPALAIATILAWTALYGWAMRSEFVTIASASPSQWTRLIIDWSVPVLLVAVAWMIGMRNSRAEARRFADTATMLSHESAQLEKRLNVVNRELSLAREFLGAQSRELDSLGRIASEKLSAHASELQQLIKTNGKQVDRIGSASETALDNMTRLRDDLPVVANSARDVSNQVGNAGRTAHAQLEKLVSGFERLNQFGTASETQVASLGSRVTQTLDGFAEQLGKIEALVGNRFTSLQTQAGAYRNEIGEAEEVAIRALNDRIALLQSETKAISLTLRDAETEAMGQLQVSKERMHDEVTKMVESLDTLDQKALLAAQERIKELQAEANRFEENLAQRDARFLEEMERRQAGFETREAQATEILGQRLADLDEAIAERREAQTAETEKLVEHSQSITAQLEQLNALIGRVSEQGETTRDQLTGGLDELDAKIQAKREALLETDAQLNSLTDKSIRLLEIIQSGAKHSREDLPDAIKVAVEELGGLETRATALSGVMFRTGQHGSELGNQLIKTQESVTETDSAIELLQAKLDKQSEETLAKLTTLKGALSDITEQGETFAGETQQGLREALEQLETATEATFAALDEGAREKVTALANDIGKDAVEALERSLRSHSAETIGKLEQAAAHASGVGREATVQLRDQLVKVNELTGNLEQRIADAQEKAEERINNDFARRMSLITDSLNSSAIDISSALTEEVSDTAWDAYLKGDRGIFTRRAVRLVDNSEAREIADLYQRDDAFKSNVTRYIHDFEKMLRSMLSTRDGNALGVTVLGSDMGKLYVVLAQSIERFRS
ncbi:ATPase [Erythrobacter insulae]|uniref:ATPase n=1 Tax=Erythrobacter insulae TaxID=2584124 RepID=A0A547PEJ0_9SPHN|nr:ATPase [Erythrobacter insulae]TRD12555.1 ATPase [Erythrobacter insulae]